MSNRRIHKSVIIYLSIALLAIIITSVLLIRFIGKEDIVNNSNGNLNQHQYGNYSMALSDDTQVSPSLVELDDSNIASSLQYLIEEEKLAHDVYVYFYDKYGKNIFSNISRSETTHQDKILALMNIRNIPDPRLNEEGAFTDQGLQSLYNNLIAQGDHSVSEAYKVGVEIEEIDIKDLQNEINRTSDEDIRSVLTSLKNASENHLKAFNRQI